ncbi:MAG: hypothetical protein CFH16_01167 [Alphaproteobacteria bacterium MarineAlpha5_Bin6]|nr:MAG: hypothetical protein CFH17_00102 [Alphaproteobacteria bacterium MarineAlpha5_Bin7]PPR53137.1 MAG: hypothetical protein CFH16_01167 [Alphaproteobacteria bacterium MarineAlpha5_Bin6]
MMNCTRRNFLIGGAASVFLTGINLPSKAISNNKKNLIIISLRGGMDGLSAVPIIGDKNLKKHRKKLILEETLKLDSDFALHPKLDIFHNLWKDNQAAIIHATSIPYTGRSHFDGQNLMESGGNVPYQEKTGWLGRGMLSAGYVGEGLALALPMPLLLRGVSLNDNYYPAKGRIPSDYVLDALFSSYEDAGEINLQMVMDIIRKRPVSMMTAGASRNNKSLAKQAAKLLRDENGPSVAVFELGGFDTHAAQGTIDGLLADQLEDVNVLVKVLKDNLGDSFKNTLILTLTEFGRTIKQNGGNGTEHGWGSAILMAGGLIKRSQVFTDWPGLKKSDLFEARDLKSTIDARSVYMSAMSVCFNLDPEKIRKDVFWNENLPDLSQKLFKT